jgi:hypothetical protein
MPHTTNSWDDRAIAVSWASFLAAGLLCLLALPVWGQVSYRLTWQDPEKNAHTVILERRADPGGTYAKIVSLPGPATTYTDANLPQGQGYCYRAAACSPSVCSDWSNEACASVPLVPAMPANLTISVTVTATGPAVHFDVAP